MPPPRSFEGTTLKVLIADDSAFIRTLLRKLIEEDSRLRLVGEGTNGREAVVMARELRPNVVAMDIEMPELNGLDASKAIVEEHGGRIPVIIVSSGGDVGVDRTVEALRHGAVDYIPKSSLSVTATVDIAHLQAELCSKLHYWAVSVLERGPALVPAPPPSAKADSPPPPVEVGMVDLVVIGVSTGGPATLTRLLRSMGKVPVPVIIAQHMPPQFTASLAENLGAELGLDVREASIGHEVKPGQVALLPGGRDAILRRSVLTAGGVSVRAAVTDATVHPNVDALFRSAAEAAKRPVAIILTGMGQDGTAGAAAFQHKGLPVLVQDPTTAVVPGMPEAVIEAGLATKVLAVEDIGRLAARWTSQTHFAGTKP